MKPKYMDVKVDDLTLDLENPRIARIMDMYSNPSPAQIALALGASSSLEESGGPSYQTLATSIRTNQGVIHPIVVNRKPDGQLVVIEGNTRTRIYRDFCEKKYSGNWNEIPAIVHDNLSPEAIDAIRLQAHLVGTREWDAYSKAKFLSHLWNDQLLPISQVIDFCGGNKREVMNYITAYEDMEKYYRPLLESDGDFDATRFSAFKELQRPRIKSAVCDAGFDIGNFAAWVHERKIYPLATVRKLPQVLKIEAAKNAFLKSGMDAAVRLIPTAGADDQPLSRATTAQLAEALTNRLTDLSWARIQDLKMNQPQDLIDKLADAKDALGVLLAHVQED